MAINFLNEPFRGRPFNTDNRRQCFNVAIEEDGIPENAESFNIIIQHSIPSPSIIVEPTVATITVHREWPLRIDM